MPNGRAAALARAIYMRLHEPRWTTAGYIGAYTCAFALGLVLALTQPYGFTKVIGWWTVAAGAMLLASGGTAAASSYAGQWWLERAAIWGIAGGYAMTLPAILLTHPLNQFMRAGVTLLIVQFGCVLAARYHAIRWAYLDPAR